MNHPVKKNKTIALISILIVVTVWGSAFSVTKLGVTQLPPLFLAFVRNAIASIALFPFYLMVRKKTSGDDRKAPIGILIILALTGVTLFYCFFNISLTYTGAAMGSLIQGLLPVVIALPAAIFLKEKITGRVIAGIVVSVIGVLLVGFIGKEADSNNSLYGNLLMLMSVFCWAVYTLLSKRIEHLHPVPVIFFVTLLGSIFLIPMVLIEGWGKPFPVITSTGWMAIGYLSLFSSALCYILYNHSLKTLTAAQAGNFLNLDPVIGSTIALIFLDEHFTPLQYTGGVLVLAGVWLSSATSSEAKHS